MSLDNVRYIVEKDLPCAHGYVSQPHHIMKGAAVVADCIPATEVQIVTTPAELLSLIGKEAILEWLEGEASEDDLVGLLVKRGWERHDLGLRCPSRWACLAAYKGKPHPNPEAMAADLAAHYRIVALINRVGQEEGEKR